MKTVEELYTQMRTDFTARTGMEVAEGGDLSARLYAVAAQIYALYAQGDWVSRQCFPQTAVGEYLDYHAQLRLLERKQAECAEGIVCFYGDGAGDSDRVIPAGTVCMTQGYVRFATVEDGVLAAGESAVEIAVRAELPGEAGNVAAGSVKLLAAAPVGITGCSNPRAMAGGADAESDEQLRGRIMDSFARLPNGANCAYYEQLAEAVEQVAAAVALPRRRGVGTVDVVVATAEGVPEQSLLDEIGRRMEKNREIAVDVAVMGPETVTVDVALQVAAQDFETVSARVEQAVRNYFTGGLLGQSVLGAKLGNLIYGVDGVDNYRLLQPEGDVVIEKGQLPVLGQLSVEAMV